MKITIINLQKKLSIRPIKIKKLILKILKKERVKESGWINICFVGKALIKKFNAKFHKTNSSTDVLAFDTFGGVGIPQQTPAFGTGRQRINLSNTNKKKVFLADIMISTDTAIKAAENFNTTADYELSLYVAHGILHILGYNDRTKLQIKLMRKKEKQYVDR